MKKFIEYEPDEQANHPVGQNQYLPVHAVVMIEIVMFRNVPDLLKYRISAL